MSTSSLKSTQTEISSDAESSSAKCDLVKVLPTSQQKFKLVFMQPRHIAGIQSTANHIKYFNENDFQVSFQTIPTPSVGDSLKKAFSSMILNPLNIDRVSSSSVAMSKTSDNLESKEIEWFKQFRSLQPLSDPKDIFTYSRLCFKLRKEDSHDKILQLMLLGCSQFCYNMRFGTPQDHKNLWNRVAQANIVASKMKGVKLIISIIPQISCRIPMTGKMKAGLKRIVFKSGMQVLVTADRSYATRCSKKVIYINLRSQFHLFRATDTIQIGEVILQVRKTVKVTLECEVLTDGQLTSEMVVHLPYICQADLKQVSSEEMEDLQFCTKEGISCLLLPTPGNEDCLQPIRNCIYNLKEMRLLACVSPHELHSVEHALWISKNYDGVMLVAQSCPCTQQISQESTKQFIKQLHDFHKPLVVQYNQCHFCEESLESLQNSDPEYCFYYPDEICLTDIQNAESLQMKKQTLKLDKIESFRHIALRKLNEPNVDRSSSGSNSMARTISRMSYEFNSKAILLCSASGRMAIKISHFRPNCPITTYRNLPDSYKLCRADRLLVRLLHGLVYGLRLGFFQHDDQIMFCYKKPADVAYTNAVVPFQVDAVTVWKYFEMLKGELSTC